VYQLHHTCPKDCNPQVVLVLQILLGIMNNSVSTLDRTAIDPSTKPMSNASILIDRKKMSQASPCNQAIIG